MTKEKHTDYQFLDEAQRKETERVAGGEGQRVGGGMFGDAVSGAAWSDNENARKRAKKLMGRRVSKN